MYTARSDSYRRVNLEVHSSEQVDGGVHTVINPSGLAVDPASVDLAVRQGYIS